jgi:alpha-L-rhamnosidase
MKHFYQKYIWLPLVIGLPFSAAAQGISPTHLQCEAKANPLGLSETSPRLSWQVAATQAGERGQFQTAYQIQVASSPELLAANQGDLWDTGQVATNRTTQISYAGSMLTTDQAGYWHVRVWDNSGQPSAWSSPAAWSMGLLLTTNSVPLAQITWVAQGRFTNNSVLSLAGAVSNEVYGVDFGGSAAQTTANGYKFADYATSGNMSVAGSGFGLYGGYLTGGATTGDAALNSLLTHGLYGSTANTGTLKNLTVGQTYTVLALLADTRGSAAGGTVFTLNDGMADSPSQAYAFANGSPAVGGYIMGTFTATATTQALTIKNISAAANSQYNAVLLEKSSGTIIPPSTNSVQSKWTGQWIGRDDAPAVISAAPTSKTYLAATHVRKDFNLSQLPSRAILYVTSLGVVEPHLNGAKVGSDYFVPGWTDYTKRVYYRAYDVTTLLQPGANTVGAILGDGWFRGNISILGQNYYGTTTRLCAELHLFYASGTNQVIASDGSWTAGFGPIQQSDIQAGEQYDARLELPGWDRPGFSNASWTSVTNGASVTPVISAAPAEPVGTNQEIIPIAITQPQTGLYVVNFGQNFAGWTRLALSNQPAGSTIVMRFGEWLNPDGTVFRDNLRSAAATDTYICKGGGVEIWEPHFTYHGFQYLEVTGLAQAPTTDTFTGVVVHSGLSEAGAFQCSNDQINRIWMNMLWTMRANYFDIPTDCPQRDERMGWCDGTEVMRSGMFAMQGESFFGKWYQDMVDGKLDATTFPQMAPTPHKDFGFASGWSDCGVLVPYWVYQTYGDTRLASRFYSDMQSHLQHYQATAINYVGQSGSYSDWLAVDGSTPGNLVSTAFYARCASEMAEMAQILGKTADAATYQQLFTNICAAFQTNFVASDGTVGSGSQSGYVLALNFNLLTPAQRTLAATKLVAAVQAQNGHPSTGMVTTYMLLPTLTSIGRSDLAYQMLAKTDYPSWGYMLGLGATTIWERWNSVNLDGTVNTESMNSLNHANFGTCAEWFYRGILGIDMLQPGFRQILINPQVGGGLTSAQGYYDSIPGRIASAWQFTNNVLTLQVTIPENTTAEIHVPTTNASAITESGVPAASSPGVTYVGISNSAAIYTVGSGNYLFTSPFSVPVIPVAPGVIITATNQTGSGSGTFYPNWTIVTKGSLIAGQAPSVAAGNFSEEVSGRNVNSLTAGGSLGLTLITGTSGTTCSTNYVTCGNGTGSGGSSAGSTIIYTLPVATYGYNLTNITVYGGWADNGRDQQAYTVYYSTVTAPTNFIPLTVVNYNPSIASGIQSATRVMLTSSGGVLATNAAAVKFDFTSPASENGYCGYAGISIFGTPGIAPAVPAALNAMLLTPNSFVMNVGSLVVGRNLMLQSTSNLASGVWITETNFVATQSAAAFTNFTTNSAQQFYRVVGY